LDYTHARIVGKDGKLVVCTGDELKCTAFADAKATPAAATWPGNPESPKGTYGRVDSKLAVCMGKTCNKVGDKLTKAALRVKAEISSDLAVVVLDNLTAWNVAADAPMKLVKPAKAETDTPVIHV